jgi:WD40 repeat protein
VGHTQAVSARAFSPDGRTLASGSLDRSVRLWQPGTGQEVAALEAHTGAVRALAFSPDGSILASGGFSSTADDAVILWRANPGQSPEH